MRALPGNEESPNEQPRRRQFTLRALLFWTALAAFCLGSFRSREMDTEFIGLLVCLVAFAAVVRALLGAWAAALLSVMGGIVLFLGCACWQGGNLGLAPGEVFAEFGLNSGVVGGAAGLIAFVGVHSACLLTRGLEELLSMWKKDKKNGSNRR